MVDCWVQPPSADGLNGGYGLHSASWIGIVHVCHVRPEQNSTRSPAPAPKQWPIIDFVAFILMFPMLPNTYVGRQERSVGGTVLSTGSTHTFTFLMAFTSALSPTSVLVAWALM